jgi:hypothetical protein
VTPVAEAPTARVPTSDSSRDSKKCTNKINRTIETASTANQ